jgi:hypothetical protein
MTFFNSLKRGLNIGQNLVRRGTNIASKVNRIIHSSSPLIQHLSSHVGSSIGGAARGYSESVNKAVRGVDRYSDRINGGLQKVGMAASMLAP